MKVPSNADTVVKVRAYLTDESFGYTHWRAAQFSAPNDSPTRYAVLVLCDTEAERDALASRMLSPSDGGSMADKTQHDVGKTTDPRSGGEHPKPPDPSNIEQGSKNPDVRDKGDRADTPTPKH